MHFLDYQEALKFTKAYKGAVCSKAKNNAGYTVIYCYTNVKPLREYMEMKEQENHDSASSKIETIYRRKPTELEQKIKQQKQIDIEQNRSPNKPKQPKPYMWQNPKTR